MNYQECNVVMLSTKDKTSIRKNKKTEILAFNAEFGHHPSWWNSFQHLYITNPKEEIKEGDWFYDKYANQVFQVNEHHVIAKWWCKIIATTDENLWIAGKDEYGSLIKFLIPRIPIEFIKLYCEQGGIDKVLVEYVSNSKYIKIEQGEYPIGIHRDLLKVSPDNTISIKPIKDSWSREEVIRLINESLYDLIISKNPSIILEDEEITDWIKENL